MKINDRSRLKTEQTKHPSIFKHLFWVILFISISQEGFSQQVTLLKELKIADNGLYFNGHKRSNGDLTTDGSGFDYFFGRRITPHGDCIKTYGDYVFMSWWSGGEEEKHVMLSRYNVKTEVLETIEFPHTHVGFRHKYAHIGDSHNTIAVGVSPIDGTVHLLYDMHSYSKSEFPESFFNYNVSKEGAALAPDGEFTLDKFNAKQTYLNQIYNYSDITYPNFFLNNKDELFVWFREGGNNNGSYKFAKYNGMFWGPFTDFNVLNAKSKGLSYNWGLYGDLKYVSGKLRVGFVKRMNIKDDPYVNNNGFHYAYSNDQNGKDEWYNYKNQPLSLPIIDPQGLFFYEPGDEVANNGANSVNITTGADWTVTDDESVHFIINNVRGDNSTLENVHAYKTAGQSEFTITTDFPGGNLHAVRGNLVFLAGLEGGRPYIYFTEGGTNDWQLLYQAKGGISFRHMNVWLEDDKMYLYLMENSWGDSQPIYLQVYDLGLPEVVPLASNAEVSGLKVFPNPVNDVLNIASETQQPLQYTIYSLLGNIVSKGSTATKSISVDYLQAGTYMLYLKNKDVNKHLRFVVE